MAALIGKFEDLPEELGGTDRVVFLQFFLYSLLSIAQFIHFNLFLDFI